MQYRIKMKSCQRCGGDLSLERDQYGAYVACIQCGANWHMSHFPEPATRTQDARHETTRNKPVLV